MTVKDAERGTSGAPRSGPCSLTAVRAEATTVKITSKGAHLYMWSGEIEDAVERSRLFDCLIRSVRV